MIEGMYEHERDEEGNFVSRPTVIPERVMENAERAVLHNIALDERVVHLETAIKKMTQSMDEMRQALRSMGQRLVEQERELDNKVDLRGRDF